MTRNVRRRSTAAIVLAASAALAAGVLPASAVGAPGPTAPTAPPVTVAASDGSTTHSISPAQARALGTPRVAAGSSHAVVARAFALQNARALGIRGDLGPSRSVPSIAGGSVVRFDQTVGGVPVMGGQVVVHVGASGAAQAAVSETMAGDAPVTTPTVSAANASSTARAYIAREVQRPASSLAAAPPALTVYDPEILGAPGVSGARLVWRTEVTSSTDVGIRRLVLVDALMGAVALSFDEIDHAKSRTVCDAANVAGVGVPCVTPVRVEGGAVSAVADVELAYDYAGRTYDFYKTVLGRDSIDGAGMPLVSTVRYCDPAETCPYQNAFWDGTQMVYGAGFASADDVVAHELTHGVTERTSGLFYFYESGAINESLSDIFGEFVDLSDGVGTDNATTRWQMGEDLASLGVIRDMSDPTIFGDPDRTDSPLYSSGTDSFGPVDGGGVHTNSGVGNKFAYLLTDGDTFNGFTVTGIGVTKAAKIIYAASQFLTSGADYDSFGGALQIGCASLLGSQGITAGDCDQVDKAVWATNMLVAPPARAFSDVPDVCVNHPGAVAVPAFSDDFENNASGRWSRGSAGWYYANQSNPYSSSGWVPKYAASGVNNIWGDDPGATAVRALTMTSPVTVPANGYLSFNHAFAFDQDSNGMWDGGVVEYSVSGTSGPWLSLTSSMTNNGVNAYNGIIEPGTTNPLAGRDGFVGSSRGYQTALIDFQDLAGQSVTLRFALGSDSSLGSYGWFIDDVEIGGCLAPDSTPPALTTTAMRTVYFTSPVFTARATDASGVVGFVVRKRTATARTAFTAWGTPKTRTGSKLTWVEPFKAGTTTCLSIQAKDALGNLSRAQVRCATTPIDERALTRSTGSTWVRAASSAAYLKTLSTSKKVGNSLLLTRASGTGLILVVRKGKGAGVVSVWVGTKRVALLRLGATTTQLKLPWPIKSGAFTNKTVKVKVDGVGTAGVTIDGLAVVRA